MPCILYCWNQSLAILWHPGIRLMQFGSAAFEVGWLLCRTQRFDLGVWQRWGGYVLEEFQPSNQFRAHVSAMSMFSRHSP